MTTTPANVAGRTGTTFIGGAEARLLAATCGRPWVPGADLSARPAASAASRGTVVVFGTYDDLLTVLRTRPARTIWRPTGVRLPLSREAPWALRRVHVAVAPDDLVGDAVAAAGAPTIVIPEAIAGPGRPRPDVPRPAGDRGGPPPGVRIAVVVDALDHTPGAALTVIAALAGGVTGTCARCARVPPVTFSPHTAHLVEPPACPCGGAFVPAPALDVTARVTLGADVRTAWALEYLTGLRTWFGLEDRVVLDDPAVLPAPPDPFDPFDPFDAFDPFDPFHPFDDRGDRPAPFDLHLVAGGAVSVPRGVLRAGAAGVPSVVAGYGACATRAGVRPCGFRTETIADDTVRVHADLADAAAAIVALTRQPVALHRLAGAARAAADAHDVDHLVPLWARVLAGASGPDRGDPLATRPRPVVGPVGAGSVGGSG